MDATTPPDRSPAGDPTPDDGSRTGTATGDGPPSVDGRAPLVTLEDVEHRFGDTEALRSLAFSVPQGRITVLLGPNGAGKTTAIRAITGALVPTSGTVRTFGLDPDLDGHLVRPRCGVVAAKPALYDRLSGYDNLVYSAELYGVQGDLAGPIAAAAERFGISDALDKLVGGYSTGMKTRLALARSILHDPELLMFDEPTSGLDPESSVAVLALIREMADDGRTVVMCTHLLAEAEGLADHVVMMEGGTALVEGSPTELTQRYWPHPIVEIDAEDPRLLDRIASWAGVFAYRRTGSGARIELDDLDRLPGMISALCDDGLRLRRIDPHVPTLEDLYFTIRRQAAGTAAPDALEPIAPSWASAPPTVPPQSGPPPGGPLTDPFAGLSAPDRAPSDEGVAR